MKASLGRRAAALLPFATSATAGTGRPSAPATALLAAQTRCDCSGGEMLVAAWMQETRGHMDVAPQIR